MSNHQPKRTCVGCRKVDSPDGMLRIVRAGTTEPVELRLDLEGSAHGRGAWVHREASCMNAALNRGGLQRSFKAQVSTESLVREFEGFIHPNRGTEPLLEAG